MPPRSYTDLKVFLSDAVSNFSLHALGKQEQGVIVDNLHAVPDYLSNITYIVNVTHDIFA